MAEKLDTLKREHAEKLAAKEDLRKRSEDMETKLDRAGQLVTGLAGERVRWENTVAVRSAHTHTHNHTGINTQYKLPHCLFLILFAWMFLFVCVLRVWRRT